MCLPLLPANRIREGFAYLKGQADRLDVNSPFHKLMDYFERQWMIRVCTCILSISILYEFISMHLIKGGTNQYIGVRYAHANNKRIGIIQQKTGR